MAIKKNVEDARQSPSRGRDINAVLWISVILSVLALFTLLGVFVARDRDGPGIVTPGSSNRAQEP